MSPSEKQQQIIRFIAGGSVTLFMLAIIVLTATTLNRSLYHLLWGMPVIAVSLLDIYFLSRSLLQKPKTIDVRLSSLLIGLGTTFGFSVAVMVLSPQQAAAGFAADFRLIGVALSLALFREIPSGWFIAALIVMIAGTWCVTTAESPA